MLMRRGKPADPKARTDPSTDSATATSGRPMYLTNTAASTSAAERTVPLRVSSHTWPEESRDHTEWHNVVLWRNLADVTDRFVHKGSQVYIEGRLRSREWTDQQGIKRYSIEILADDLKLLGRRSDNSSAGQSQGQGGQHRSGQPYGGGYGQSQPYSGGYGQQQGGYGGGQGYQPQQQPSVPEVNVNDDPDDLPF